MMYNVLTDFCHNEEAVRKCRAEICPSLWGKWEAAVLKKDIQKRILTKAYGYFRFLNPRPYFCYKIESYSDNRFGVKIKELFLEGGAEGKFE